MGLGGKAPYKELRGIFYSHSVGNWAISIKIINAYAS